MLGGVKSMYTLAKCRKYITGARPYPSSAWSFFLSEQLLMACTTAFTTSSGCLLLLHA